MRHRSPGFRLPRSLPRLAAAGLVLAASIAAHGAPRETAQAVAPLRLPGTQLEIDRPEGWRVGGTIGYGVLVSLIGRADGFPNFSVMTDPEVRPEPSAADSMVEGRLEELFEQLVADRPDAEVHDARWIELAGMRVHSSDTSWKTIAGRMRARRLLLAIDGRPYILTWAELESRFGEIAELVDRCIGSLRPASAPGTVGTID